MSVIVIAEVSEQKVQDVTHEVVAAAHSIGGKPIVIVPCTSPDVAETLATIEGVEHIIAAKSDVFAQYDAASWAEALHQVIPEGTIVAAASQQSKDLCARLAAIREIPVVQDIVSINDGELTSPIYSGKAMQTVQCSGYAVLTIRANIFSPVASQGSTTIQVLDTTGNIATSVQEMMQRASTRLDVSEANIIISGGRGMGSPSNFSHLEEIADVLGAAVGASRAAVDTWDEIPHSMQVGQTGKTVNPNLYIAVGISGAIQHLAGMRSSKYIVAINKDADAPIFQHADYGIVATWEEALPVLRDAFKSMMN